MSDETKAELDAVRADYDQQRKRYAEECTRTGITGGPHYYELVEKWQTVLYAKREHLAADGRCASINPNYRDFICAKPAGHVDQFCEASPGSPDGVIWDNERLKTDDRRRFEREIEAIASRPWESK